MLRFYTTTCFLLKEKVKQDLRVLKQYSSFSPTFCMSMMGIKFIQNSLRNEIQLVHRFVRTDQYYGDLHSIQLT